MKCLVWIDDRYLCSGTANGCIHCWDIQNQFNNAFALTDIHDDILAMCFSAVIRFSIKSHI